MRELLAFNGPLVERAGASIMAPSGQYSGTDLGGSPETLASNESEYPSVLWDCPDSSEQSETISGGQGGIRTHGELAPSLVFKTSSLNHSDTCPALGRV
jgi:hypothetical protein